MRATLTRLAPAALLLSLPACKEPAGWDTPFADTGSAGQITCTPLDALSVGAWPAPLAPPRSFASACWGRATTPILVPGEPLTAAAVIGEEGSQWPGSGDWGAPGENYPVIVRLEGEGGASPLDPSGDAVTRTGDELDRWVEYWTDSTGDFGTLGGVSEGDEVYPAAGIFDSIRAAVGVEGEGSCADYLTLTACLEFGTP